MYLNIFKLEIEWIVTVYPIWKLVLIQANVVFMVQRLKWLKWLTQAGKPLFLSRLSVSNYMFKLFISEL